MLQLRQGERKGVPAALHMLPPFILVRRTSEKMKKFALVIIAIIVAFSSVYPPEVAHANLISKPISIAAKKAAKIPIKNTAVEMANQIVSDYLVRELIEGVKTDDGYSPVCMDGKKDSIKDCPPDKRAQVKTKLSSTDKSKLEKTVESVLEKKTNTSSKWGKFLDLFVPLFLVSGAIEIISASLDGDILSFFDEVAQDSLLETGLLKPLLSAEEIKEELYDFERVIQHLDFKIIEQDKYDTKIEINAALKATVNMSYYARYNISDPELREITYDNNLNFVLDMSTFAKSGPKIDDVYYSYPRVRARAIIHGNRIYTFPADSAVYIDSKYYLDDEAFWLGANWVSSTLFNMFQQGSINDRMNKFVSVINTADAQMTFDIPQIVPKPVQTDYGKQTATDKIKDSNGKVPLKGINSFTFKYGDTHIYPSNDSVTGWKNKTTGEDITVVEDDVVVDDGSGTDPKPPDPTDTDDPPDKDKTKKELEDESKKLGNLVTTRFPFSLPWDFVAMVKLLYAEPMTPKWEVKGTEEIPLNFTINLNFLDPYISWFRGFIMVGFVISVIFMHSRFMGGSK